jgi:hypothetical protein
MSFNISPREYLAMAEEAHAEFKSDELSLRRLITSCTFANHLPEIIFTTYGTNSVAKVHGHSSKDTYRAYAVNLCPEIGIIRDLCDFGKHGPALNRRNVQVANTGKQSTPVLDTASFAMGVPNHVMTDKLVITLRDGKERLADYVISEVVEFWQRTFAADGL